MLQCQHGKSGINMGSGHKFSYLSVKLSTVLNKQPEYLSLSVMVPVETKAIILWTELHT